MAIQHSGQHIQRVRVDFIQLAQARRRPGQRHIALLGGQFQRQPALAVWAGLGQHRARRQGARRDAAIVLLGQLKHRLGINIAHHHQGGVVRRVPAFTPLAQVVGAHALQVGHPANNRLARRIGGDGGCVQLLKQHASGLVFGALAALFTNHADLAGKIRLGDVQMRHAVCFQRHRLAQGVVGQLLEIHRVVAAGEGVFLAAQRGNAAGELTRGHFRRPFEHHVLQRVRHAGDAGHFVHTAHPIPQLRHGHRRAAVYLDHHFQAIGQRGFLWRIGPDRRGAQGGGQAQHRAQTEGLRHGFPVLHENLLQSQARCRQTCVCTGAHHEPNAGKLTP